MRPDFYTEGEFENRPVLVPDTIRYCLPNMTEKSNFNFKIS